MLRAILFGAIFLTGFIISYIFTLLDRLRFRKVVKSLGAEINSQNKNIAALINELESVKGSSSGNKKEIEEEEKEVAAEKKIA